MLQFHASLCFPHVSCGLLDLLFKPEGGGSMFLRNVSLLDSVTTEKLELSIPCTAQQSAANNTGCFQQVITLKLVAGATPPPLQCSNTQTKSSTDPFSGKVHSGSQTIDEE
jgi:hypothetical protein